jgi:hypothetical protein
MSVRRECCNYCMWFGPVNQDDTMRKHRPATLEDQWGQPNKVQDMTAEPCPGSNKPFATFGCETVPDPNPLFQETDTVTANPAACPAHGIADKRGAHAAALDVTCCAAGTTYGVWDENDGGFTYVVDCAMDAANWAADQLDEDPDSDMVIKAVCREHEEQPADGCEDCDAEPDYEESDDDEDA